MTPTGLPVTLLLDGRRVVVLGGGAAAADKLALLAGSGAEVTLIAPDLEPACADQVARGAATHLARPFAPADLEGAALLLDTERDPALVAAATAAARARGVLVWTMDDLAHSDLAMPAVARLGPARLAISTAGCSPTLAARLRRIFETALGPRFARFVTRLGEERARARADQAAYPDFEARRRRQEALLAGFDVALTVHYPDWFDKEPDERLP